MGPHLDFRNITLARLYQIWGTNAEAPLLDVMALVMIATAVVTYVTLQAIPAPYGRYASNAFGPLIPSNVAWFIQECPSFFVPLFVYIRMNSGYVPIESKILMALFGIHYFQRTFIYSTMIRGGKKTPLVPFLLAFIFCTYNGYMQARAILKFRGAAPNIHHPYFIAGVAIFLFGMFINIQSDHILRNLRQEGSEHHYQIPYGGLFEYITSANYFGELLEWFGFALAAYQLQALAFAVFTFSNLVPRAITHQEWYVKTFKGKYPRDRYAILPFLV
ncbi:hypothetical protein RvY_05610 [Ramazzottius varieornatus]|uniref:3-oxo-5alpha-steroid 4-dehydrogenase (NADP(+)) n=1 Tax=Ramazzottius varieornatus TaxID=947166 RepID=A0A1D1UVM0_RAMVA|nr:hypothetical protein RvY_05610 [Ramazzottius varieornatus]